MAMVRQGHELLKDILRHDVPYIMEDVRIGYVRQGSARLTANLIDHDIEGGMLVFIGAGCVMQFDGASSDFDLCGVMVSDERFRAAVGGHAPAWADGAEFVAVKPETDDFGFVRSLFDSLWNLINRESYPDDTLNGLISALVGYYGFVMKNVSGSSAGKISHQQDIFSRFISLVNTFCGHERSLAFYADRICVTPRYLGAVVRHVSGITASEWIKKAVVTRAKIMLRYGGSQVAQIADELNFANASFFCKYFKRATGFSPQSYRRLPQV